MCKMLTGHFCYAEYHLLPEILREQMLSPTYITNPGLNKPDEQSKVGFADNK